MSEELSILESCCLRPMMRNSVLEELRVRRFAARPVSGSSSMTSTFLFVYSALKGLLSNVLDRLTEKESDLEF